MKLHRSAIAFAALAAVLLAGACASQASPPSESGQPAAAGAASRGEMLYENHCTICHTSVVHVQENHHATSDADVERWVRRWSADQQLGWSDDEVMAVTGFLLRRYYGF